jgi:hypothetical protein
VRNAVSVLILVRDDVWLSLSEPTIMTTVTAERMSGIS